MQVTQLFYRNFMDVTDAVHSEGKTIWPRLRTVLCLSGLIFADCRLFVDSFSRTISSTRFYIEWALTNSFAQCCESVSLAIRVRQPLL